MLCDRGLISTSCQNSWSFPGLHLQPGKCLYSTTWNRSDIDTSGHRTWRAFKAYLIGPKLSRLQWPMQRLSTQSMQPSVSKSLQWRLQYVQKQRCVRFESDLHDQMVRLAVAVAKHIHGRVHVQTNPYYSYSSEKTIFNALRTLISSCKIIQIQRKI